MKSRKKPAETAAPPQVIYIGPNLPGGRLTQYTVFSDGIPEYLVDLTEAHPEIKELTVPVTELARVQANISTPGTTEYTAYRKLGGRG
ncbi:MULTISPECIES: hypothetical protein [Paenibacillus]|uniref:hypothetical protein n=1 Tax=Paenibacillus TaxID=44249 RepID=UPI0022B8B959|nr:hypothetical protein [Paenibacillus caseinilyticus]MCZ8520128.1 hypothetical protein [Paenibacillus caseinilyticus]